ncbi:histone-lysine N-methyltransferase EHMT2-like [Dreissena polymorpha]|uniref:histone-lysine N-methyltransferase EHMT2-like n=1 Tax=Dreissena polymorpha TaxID=45954 RepID=UPI002264E234|nr:histone-lysine N-methyltransferase EHMT2-like [Dreissena polymorpha]
MSIDSDVVPDDMKAARVTPIYKKSSPLEVGNYRPSYLTDRTQLVHTNKVSSNSLEVTCGVPQGSILGPLLFLCYVKDMPTCIDTDCKLILYADDSVILFAHKDSATISNKLSREEAEEEEEEQEEKEGEEEEEDEDEG